MNNFYDSRRFRSCQGHHLLRGGGNNNNHHQLSLPTRTTTSCLFYQRKPPAVSTIGDNSTSCPNYFHHLYDHNSITYNKIHCHLLLLLSYFHSIHCLLAVNFDILLWVNKKLPVVNLLARTTKIICWG